MKIKNVNRKILIITPSKFPGTAGDSANYSEIITALTNKGFDILLICPLSLSQEENSFASQVRISRVPFSPPRLSEVKLGIKPIHVSRFAIFLILQYMTIIWRLKNRDIKCAFMRHDVLTMNVSFLLKLLGVKVIVADGIVFSEGLNNFHLPELFKKLLLGFEKAIFKWYSYFLVSTHGQGEKMANWGCPREKILLMPMSIKVSEIPFVPPNKIPPYTFGFFGALEQWQGPDTLLKAFRKVSTKIPESRLFIIGDGSMKEQLKEYTHSNDLGKHVIFVDGLPRKKIWNEYFSKFQIVVIPRPKRNDFFDSLPSIKLVESLAAGKAIITTDIDAMKEISREIITTVPPNDPESLADMMCDLSKDIDKLNRLSCAAVKYAQNYDIYINIEKIQRIFS